MDNEQVSEMVEKVTKPSVLKKAGPLAIGAVAGIVIGFGAVKGVTWIINKVKSKKIVNQEKNNESEDKTES